jgi:hypothetical protein
MQMNPKYYFDNFVIPNYDEFCADEGNVRKAFNAVISLASMTDNCFNYYERRGDPKVAAFMVSANKKDNFIAFKNHLRTLSSYFNDLQSMSNAYKHLYTNAGNVYVTVESGGAVFVGEFEAEENDDISNELKDGYCSQVYYSTKDGDTYPVKEALDDMVKVWKTIL